MSNSSEQRVYSRHAFRTKILNSINTVTLSAMKRLRPTLRPDAEILLVLLKIHA